MIKLFDDEFFAAIGAEKLAKKQRDRFVAAVEEELHSRVGKRIRDGLSEEKINEFCDIIDGDDDYNFLWLLSNYPDYEDSRVYIMLIKRGYTGMELINQTASVLWLMTNRPDYQEIVEMSTEELCMEIIGYKDDIFADDGDDDGE